MNGLSRTVRSYEVQEVLRPLAHQRGVFLCPMHQQSGGCEMERITRRERRALRQLRFVTAREASLAARLAHLDYRVSNEAGRPKGAHPLPDLAHSQPPERCRATTRPGMGAVRTCPCSEGPGPGHPGKAPDPQRTAEADSDVSPRPNNGTDGGDPATTGLEKATATTVAFVRQKNPSGRRRGRAA